MTAAITDMTQYSALRVGAKNNDPAALREVAGQFEALFLQSMLKSMRDASIGDPLFGDSNAHDMYEDMLDQQLAVEMASGKGIGLAEMLVRQLGGEQTARPSAERMYDIERKGTGAEVRSYELRPGDRASDAQGYEIRGKRSGYPIEAGMGAYPIAGSAPAAGPRVGPAWDNPENFARDVWPHAQRVARELNVPAEGVLAQAALETGWGRHVMPGQDGTASMNLFGIKAGRSWSGDSVAQRTIEFDGDIARQEVARFRSYSDVAESFDDYANLITSNARYESVRNHGNDVQGFAAALADSGYATDPQYAQKIARVASSDTMSRVLNDLKTNGQAPINR